MDEFIHRLVGTVTLRPYVFVFLAAYVVHGIVFYSWRKVLTFSVIAYLVAWACEWGSINHGFPFGDYKYLTDTVDKEVWIGGVPLFDSLSFIFLGYFSSHVGGLWLSRKSWLGRAFFSGLLMMYLDVIIDPLTLQGDKWFLGSIYYYPNPGPYFGVTLANFWGWFGLGVVLALISGLVFRKGQRTETWMFRWSCLAVYFGVVIFNLAITFSIGDHRLGWVGVFLMSPILLHFLTRPKPSRLWS